MRVLLWLGLFVLVLFALKKKGQAVFAPKQDATQAPPAETGSGGESMLCCERCHVYFPASEAVLRGDKVYCCAAHADQV